jgi:SAM-dependent methyltransferase
MLSRLKTYYFRQMMHPGPLGLLVNPFYFARRGLLVAIRQLAPKVGGRVVDIGCGSRPYESLFRASGYVGLELDTPDNRLTKKADVYYDGKTFPFEANTFDSAICNQVLEHVFEPDAFVREIARVLKIDGVLLLTVPFVWDEHEQPRDFGRYSSFGLTALLERNGFEVIEFRKTIDDVRTIFQMLNAYLFKITRVHNAYLALAVTLVLMAPFNLAGTVLSWVMPRNEDFYLDNVVLARKVAEK